MDNRTDWFVKSRYGLFVHYGLYSMLERGEWVLNRERIPLEEYKNLAKKFNPEKFDADYICSLAVKAGMKYITFTTMHHDGFCLYNTSLTGFNSVKACGRDLVAEVVKAARGKGLKVSLYHSLNNWTEKPDGADALESPEKYEKFIKNTHERIKELVTLFNPIDVLWYDGWWPFNAKGWKAEEMNSMVREIQPHIIFNGRNGLPGDFSTPEGHMSCPARWRPWEACMTLNDHWGYHRGDNNWKSSLAVIDLLSKAAAGKGNLLLNIGPRGNGEIPEESVRILEETGSWLKRCGESVFDTDLFVYGLEKREKGHAGDWSNTGNYTAKENALYLIVKYWTGKETTIAGLKCKVKKAFLLGTEKREIDFRQDSERVIISGLPEKDPDPVCSVIRLDCESAPEMYLTAGMRVPEAHHPPYDPCPSDIQL